MNTAIIKHIIFAAAIVLLNIYNIYKVPELQQLVDKHDIKPDLFVIAYFLLFLSLLFTALLLAYWKRNKVSIALTVIASFTFLYWAYTINELMCYSCSRA